MKRKEEENVEEKSAESKDFHTYEGFENFYNNIPRFILKALILSIFIVAMLIIWGCSSSKDWTVANTIPVVPSVEATQQNIDDNIQKCISQIAKYNSEKDVGLSNSQLEKAVNELKFEQDVRQTLALKIEMPVCKFWDFEKK